MSNDNSQFAWQVHSYLSDYIKFGDTKAALLSGLTGPLIVGLIGVSGWKLEWNCETFFLLTSIVLFAIAFGFAFASIWPNLSTDKVKRSRARSTSLEANGKEIPDKGVIYWKNIRAHLNANTFSDALAQMTEEERLKHVGNHCYELAGITDRKHWLITISSRFFAAGMITLIIFAAIHAKDVSDETEEKARTNSSQPLASLDSDVSALARRLNPLDLFV